MAGRDDLLRYYARRLPEYDEIYARPERQEDLRSLRSLVEERLRGRRVLEIACGTGYWTEVLAGVASSVLATDASAEVLDAARRRTGWPAEVRFAVADAFQLEVVAGEFDALFAGFLWSHIARSRLAALLRNAGGRVLDGGRLVFADNRYVEGSSTPLSRRGEEGNTYQIRRLASGEEFEVLKNFPEDAELRARVAPHASGPAEVVTMRHYWFLCFAVARQGG